MKGIMCTLEVVRHRGETYKREGLRAVSKTGKAWPLVAIISIIESNIKPRSKEVNSSPHENEHQKKSLNAKSPVLANYYFYFHTKLVVRSQIDIPIILKAL
jgi:hypothetical protein